MTRIVLLVDDEVKIRKGLRALVERAHAGFDKIMESGNGREALDIIKMNKIDLVIADIRMPHMDGIKLMREAQKLPAKPYFIILSGYDDFEYAKESIKYGAKEYLLKPVERDELLEALRNIKSLLDNEEIQNRKQENFKDLFNSLIENELNYIIINDKLTHKQICGTFDKIKQGVLSGSFHVILVCEMRNALGDEKGRYIPLNICIDEYVRSLQNPVIRFNDKENNIVLITEYVMDYGSMKDYLDNKHSSDYFIGVSNENFKPNCFKRAYFEASDVLKHRLIYGTRRIVFHRDISSLDNSFDIPMDMINKISNMIGTNRIEEISALLNNIFSFDIIKTKHISFLENIVEAVNTNILDHYLKLVPVKGDVLGTDIETIKNIYNFNSVKEYVVALKNILLDLNNYTLELRKEYKEENTINIAIEWLNSNFHRQDMTMARVANEVSLNYSYFSLAFKKHTGMNFVNFLKKLRINKAKELLKSSDYKINETARKVGFQSPRQFAKLFREEVGISPLEYRKKVF